MASGRLALVATALLAACGGVQASEPNDAPGPGAGGAGGAGQTSSQSPPVVEGLTLWLEAGAGLGSEGSPVALWPNRIGVESDATQSAAAQQPQVASADGRTGVLFDGGDWLRFAGGFRDFSAGLSFFAVVRFDDTSTCAQLFQVSNGAEVDDISIQSDREGTSTGIVMLEVGTAELASEANALPAGRVVLLSIVLTPPAQGEMGLDNMPLPAAFGGDLVLPVVPRQQSYLGTGLYSACTAFQGMLFELLLFNRAVSLNQELGVLSTYLQQKWSCCGQ